MPRSKKNIKVQMIPFEFPVDRNDLDAVSIVRRLNRFGYFGYFVGGSVRDVLLGYQPKDFDVVTSARPREVKQIFRACRLIGRRFQLAHVYFPQNKIIEVATFRQQPPEEEEGGFLIVDDNEFGTAETDAHRRDFTINALLYDPIRKRIHDYCGGLKDIEDRILRSIGDPVVRFKEDPIRMLRAIKFAARLELTLDTQVVQALQSERSEIKRAAPPRFLQELIRMLQGGAAHRSYELLDECHFVQLLLPELYSSWTECPVLKEETFALLRRLDMERYLNRWEDGQLLSVLWWPFFRHLTKQYRYSAKQYRLFALRLLAPFATRMHMPIKIFNQWVRILSLQALMDQDGGDALKGSYAIEGLRVLELRAEVEGLPAHLLERARHSAEKFNKNPYDLVPTRRRKRRR